MKEFYMECYICSENAQEIKLSDFEESDKNRWKRDMEERALSEYYQKKIKVSNIKI